MASQTHSLKLCTMEILKYTTVHLALLQNQLPDQEAGTGTSRGRPVPEAPIEFGFKP